MAIAMRLKLSVNRFAEMAEALAMMRKLYGEIMPARLSLRVLRNLRVLGEDSNAYFFRRNEFLEKFGQRDEKQNLVPLPENPKLFAIENSDDAREAFNRLRQAGEEEIEYNLEPLDINDIGILEDILRRSNPPTGISIDITDALEPLIKEPSDHIQQEG